MFGVDALDEPEVGVDFHTFVEVGCHLDAFRYSASLLDAVVIKTLNVGPFVG